MKNIIFISVVLFFTISATTYAQSLDEKGQSIASDQEKFIALSQLDNATSQAAINRASVAQGTNAVFIQQIGADNTVLSNIVAESSDIKILQNGNENNIEIDESSRTIEKVILQTGNNNSVTDFSFNSDISTSLELIQDGDNLIFQRYGSNELSKNLKFRMSGDAKTIIVRSF